MMTGYGTSMPNVNEKFAGKTLVVGLGKTGLSVVRFLAARGESVAVTDSRDLPPGLDELRHEFPDVARFLGSFDERAFAAAERIIVSPGVALSQPAIVDCIERGIPVLGDIELFARHADAPVVAITGSNGKTTVTTLLGQMARAAGWDAGVGGNIGTPALDLLGHGHACYILELSSFQLETVESLRSRAAVVLNLSEDHMDRYISMEDYALAKARIYQGAETPVVNLDDARVTAMVNPQRQVGFTLGPVHGNDEYGCRDVDGRRWLCRGEDLLCALDELKIAGAHNLANALAALALGDVLGLPMQSMLQALRDFTGLPHRTQFVATINGVDFYNDSKATNVGACEAALMGLHRDDQSRNVAILGGDCKDADFTALTGVLEKTCRGVVLIGRDADQLVRHIPHAIPMVRATDLRDAVAQAAALAQPSDRVLLSPACASFDMFSGYEQRGQAFIDIVREMLR